MDNPWRNEKKLRELYWGQGLSSREIASNWDCSKRTVLKWMDRHDIDRRDQYEAGGPWENKELLEELYLEDGHSVYEIADQLGAGSTTISRWLDKHGIDKRKSSKEITGPWQDERVLEDLYVEKGYSISEISDEFGCSYDTVRRWLNEYNIPINDRGSCRVERTLFRTDESGYERCRGRYGFVYLHRLICAVETPLDELKNSHVHHKNGIEWDNRPSNLEVLTPEQHIKAHNE